MDSIHKLISYFKEFPGIGPRQAERFAYFLLSKNDAYRKVLAEEIKGLGLKISICNECFRFFAENEKKCVICNGKNRNEGLLMIVAKDVDLNTIEKTRIYDGHYFVLGGNIPILAKNPDEIVRTKELKSLIEKKHGNIKEIIFALSLNNEGENTKEHIEKSIKPLTDKYKITLSTLGRGLSTGTELEYSDRDTIKNALERRTVEK